jgi:CrcB protein
MVKEVLLVGTGGFVGSALRYLVSIMMSGSAAGMLPWATFTVNGAGSLLIGLFLALMGQGSWYFLLVAGFCGGFTTFSTFSAELFAMVRNGNYGQAGIYIAASIVICVLAVWLGMTLGKMMK